MDKDRKVNLGHVIPGLSPDLDMAIAEHQQLGQELADAQLAAMQQAFDERYNVGVSNLLQGKAEQLEEDRQLAQKVAGALVEERRKTLVAIALKSTLFSSISIAAALLVGLSPSLSVACVPLSGVAAICTSRRGK